MRTGMNHGQPECSGCSKKYAYVDGLGTMSFSVPEHMTIIGGDDKGAFMVEKPKTKICKNPDCQHHGRPQPLDSFYKAPNMKDGRQATCKACRRIEQHKRDIMKSMSTKNGSNGQRICANPECHLAGQPQPIGNFQKARGGSTWKTCRDCMDKKREKKKTPEAASKNIPNTTSPESIGKHHQINIQIIIDVPGGIQATIADILQTIMHQE